MKSVLEWFDEYSDKFGFKVIVVRHRSKAPVFKNWTYYNSSSHRDYLTKHPNANLGLLLGDIIDLEGDTPEANDRLNEWLVGVPHMCYRSQKSIHHLFLNPFRRLRIIKSKGIEFRGHGHQSVLPPSVNKDGVHYEWLPESLQEPTMLPPHLRKILKDKLDGQREFNVKQPWCDVCKQQFRKNGKRFDHEVIVFRSIGAKWQCQRCRTVDVRPACRAVRGGKSSEQIAKLVVVKAKRPAKWLGVERVR